MRDDRPSSKALETYNTSVVRAVFFLRAVFILVTSDGHSSCMQVVSQLVHNPKISTILLLLIRILFLTSGASAERGGRSAGGRAQAAVAVSAARPAGLVHDWRAGSQWRGASAQIPAKKKKKYSSINHHLFCLFLSSTSRWWSNTRKARWENST